MYSVNYVEYVANNSDSAGFGGRGQGAIGTAWGECYGNLASGEAKQQAQTAKLTGTPQSNGISPSIPMFDSSEDRSITKATLTEGKITLNKDSNPTQITAQALGINTDLSQANREVVQPKDINKVLKEQASISNALGNLSEAANSYADKRAKETKDKAWEEGGSKRRQMDAAVAT
ncbi:hypothetical protein, partial [Bibersteinia trehalosi]|uniref:hypothetical protein n=1 Tax=Bibersteinia trehalosi TaxID=47735 RepID=UPI001C89F1B0